MARLANIELQLLPGALTDDTDLAAKLRTIAMDKTRWRGNRPQTIGGWDLFSLAMTAGVARGIHTYADLEGSPIVVAASAVAINAWTGEEGVFTRYDITPKRVDVWLSAAAISLISGTATVTWLVYTPATDTAVAAPHGLAVGDSITISGHINKNIGEAGVVNGTWTVATVINSTQFTFVTTGTSTGALIPFIVVVNYSGGRTDGESECIDDQARSWSIDNFGETAVMCGSDGTPIFYWEGAVAETELIINGDFTDTVAGGNWSKESGWAFLSGRMRYSGTTEADLSQDISDKLEGGKTYEMSFEITTWDIDITDFRILIDAVDIFPQGLEGAVANVSDVQRVYTFRFVCPADPDDLIIRATGTGTVLMEIDNVSITAMTAALPIAEAPQKNYALFVDGSARILNVLGTNEADGDFNPLLLRWSAQDNMREWIPNTDNVAGEISLGNGSYAVCGAHVGERNLLLTDTDALAATFNGEGYSLRGIAQGCGAIGVNDLAVYNNRAFWASKNAFYSFDGTQVQTIECPVKDKFVGHLSPFQESKTFAWINIEFSEVWFHYPHADDGTEISRYLIFNFIEQGNPWSFGSFDRTCMAPAGIIKNPIGIDVAGNIWRHEQGTAMPGNITLPFLETGYLVGQAGDRWLGARRYYPDIENQTGNIKFTVTGKRAPQGQNNMQTVGPLLLIPDEPKLDFVLSCRQLKFRWESEATPTWWRLGVVGLEMTADKERR